MAIAQPSSTLAVPKIRRLFEQDRFLGPLLIAPAILYIVLLVGFPFVFAIYLSLTDATVGNPRGMFIGLENFREILQTRAFITALKNTFFFTFVSQGLILILAEHVGPGPAVGFSRQVHRDVPHFAAVGGTDFPHHH